MNRSLSSPTSTDLECFKILAEKIALKRIDAGFLDSILTGPIYLATPYIIRLSESVSAEDAEKLATVLTSSNCIQKYAHHVRKLLTAFYANKRISFVSYKEKLTLTANTFLSLDVSEKFVNLDTNIDESSLACIYSLAKHGSHSDIKKLAKLVASKAIEQIEDPDSDWRAMLEAAKKEEGHIVLLVPGSRNVESASNIIFDIALPIINIKLSMLGYPVITNVKLPRIDPPCENYASLSLEEREQVSLVQDHILPDRNFYNNRDVHVIFGDDVLITGATADKVLLSAFANGAKSFRAIYPVIIDPQIVHNNPSVEEHLNMYKVSGRLDESAYSIFSQEEFIPVMKSLSLILDIKNKSDLPHFLNTLPVRNVLKIYLFSMSNGYLMNKSYSNSLEVIKNFLVDKGLLDANGQPPIN